MGSVEKIPLGDIRTSDGGFMHRMSALLQRSGFARLLGQVFEGKRDYYEVFGYDRTLDTEQMWEMYHRGGIAHRIIHAYPDAVWGRPPQLHMHVDAPTPTTPTNPIVNPEPGTPPASTPSISPPGPPPVNNWDNDWDKFARSVKLWDAIKKADILAGLGRYSIILVGTNQANMANPLRKGARITYLQPYSEYNVTISEWDRDPTSPRFGLPLYYNISPNRNRNRVNQGATVVAPVAAAFRAHYSRVWHFARGTLESSVYGIPRYAPIWNYLMDLMKVVGSSAESYWMTAYQGLHANIDAEMEMNEDDAADLSDEVDEYQHGLRRFIRTRGVEVKTLGSKVADPRGAFDVVLTLISGTTGIPKRILLGSEAGQLASSQDRNNWAERIEEERSNYAEPAVIWPILQWLNDYGVMPMDLDAVQLLWPEAFRMSPLERGQTAAQTARTAANLLKAMEPIVIKKGTPATPPTTGPEGEIISEGDPGTPDETGDPLLTREEARKLIGMSTDQHAFIESPI
jgi:hypothetical protein